MRQQINEKVVADLREALKTAVAGIKEIGGRLDSHDYAVCGVDSMVLELETALAKAEADLK